MNKTEKKNILKAAMEAADNKGGIRPGQGKYALSFEDTQTGLTKQAVRFLELLVGVSLEAFTAKEMLTFCESATVDQINFVSPPYGDAEVGKHLWKVFKAHRPKLIELGWLQDLTEQPEEATE